MQPFDIVATLRLLPPEVYSRMEAMARRVTDELVLMFQEAGIVASGNAVGSIYRLYLTGAHACNYRETARDDKTGIGDSSSVFSIGRFTGNRAAPFRR